MNVRVLRERDGITRAQFRDRLAEYGVDITEAHIRGVELGWQNPSEELRGAWCRALGIKYGDLIVPGNGNGSEDAA